MCVNYIVEDETGIHEATTYTRALGTGQWITSRGDPTTGCRVATDGWVGAAYRFVPLVERYGLVVRPCSCDLAVIDNDNITVYWYSVARFQEYVIQGTVNIADADMQDRITPAMFHKWSKGK